MSTNPVTPPSLVIHDGELSDVVELLAQLRLACTERSGSAAASDEAQSWELVVATPKRLLEFHPSPSRPVPVRIAVLDKDSKTLRAMLQRSGIDLIVRRPVHPAALRLLILHSLYRGPEKRRALRVSIGARVRFRAGLRKRSAVLADLSVTGCRLLSSHRIAMDRGVVVQIPTDVAADKAFSISGTVVRSTPSEFPGIDTLAVRFDSLKRKTSQRLLATIAAYGDGPAALPAGDTDAHLAPDRAEKDAGNGTATTLLEIPHASGDAPEAAAEAAGPDAAGRVAVPCESSAEDSRHELARKAKALDRRGNTRRVYREHIVALGVEAARVLLGRDISIGGMRVEPHPDVSMDDEMKLGLHVRGREQPVVVQARVVRDDGDGGTVLQFFDLDEETRSYLERMVKFLPILAVREAGGDGGVIVCEIMDHRPESHASA